MVFFSRPSTRLTASRCSTQVRHSLPRPPPPHHTLQTLTDEFISSVGKPVKLDPEAEEVASFFAALLETDYVNNPVFVKNFFDSWIHVMLTHPPVRSFHSSSIVDDTESVTYSWTERKSKISQNAISDPFSIISMLNVFDVNPPLRPRRRSSKLLEISWRNRSRLVCSMGGRRRWEISEWNRLDCLGGEENIPRLVY